MNMTTIGTTYRLLEEIADLFASSPSREQLLNFRASESVQERVRELLTKLNAGRISQDEQRELNQYEQVEMLIRLVKARLRAND